MITINFNQVHVENDIALGNHLFQYAICRIVALKNNIDNEITQAKLNYMSSVATVSFQKKNMQLAENVYQQTKKNFEAGTGSNTEISAAQADLVSAQNNFMNALYTALISKVDLLKSTGKL